MEELGQVLKQSPDPWWPCRNLERYNPKPKIRSRKNMTVKTGILSAWPKPNAFKQSLGPWSNIKGFLNSILVF